MQPPGSDPRAERTRAALVLAVKLPAPLGARLHRAGDGDRLLAAAGGTGGHGSAPHWESLGVRIPPPVGERTPGVGERAERGPVRGARSHLSESKPSAGGCSAAGHKSGSGPVPQPGDPSLASTPPAQPLTWSGVLGAAGGLQQPRGVGAEAGKGGGGTAELLRAEGGRDAPEGFLGRGEMLQGPAAGRGQGWGQGQDPTCSLAGGRSPSCRSRAWKPRSSMASSFSSESGTSGTGWETPGPRAPSARPQPPRSPAPRPLTVPLAVPGPPPAP